MVALIAGLPADSASALRDEPWTFSEELAVEHVEHTSELLRAVALLLAGKKTSVPAQLKFDRPGDQPKRKVTWDENEIRRFFGGLQKEG